MTAFAADFFRELLAVFREASPYILLGFAIAACIQLLLPVHTVQRLLGTGRVRSIAMAALLGIPLPLCSCAVVPTALALRKRGASKGATVSFLVSTPETGEEAIAITWGLIDPLMAIFRPIAALFTAFTAGMAVEAFGEEKPRPKAGEESAPATPEVVAPEGTPHDHSSHDRLRVEEEAKQRAIASLPLREKLRRGFRGAFVELFDETSHWMLAGLVVSALIAVLLPAELVTRHLSSGILPMLVMLLIGIPMYICASASTPIAAALIMKGLSPGAAFVFLLAGPATNFGTIGILGRTLGRRVTTIYVAVIAILALGFGVMLDALYPAIGLDPQASVGEVRDMSGWIASIVVFIGLLFFSFRRVKPPAEFRAVGRAIARLGVRIDRRVATAALAAIGSAFLISTCFVVVPPGQRALVRRFGAPVGHVRGEGLHFRLPPPIDRADVFPADAVRRIELGFRSGAAEAATGAAAALERDTSPPDTATAPPSVDARVLEEEGTYLTGDENMLSTKAVVQYRVTDPARWVYGFIDPEGVLKLASLAEAVDVLASYGIDHVYAGERGDVEKRILEGIRRRTEAMSLGVEVLHFCLTDVHAPAEVHAAFRDVASAHEDKQTAVNVAWRYRDETVNLARGEAARQVELAKSDATGAVLRAEGESQSLKLRTAAYRERRTGTRERLYLEAVEEVLARTRKIVRPGWRGSGGIDLWLGSGGVPVPAADVIRGGDVRAREAEEARESTGQAEEGR